LSREAKRIWRQINSEIELPGDALLTLRVGLEAFDRYQQARTVLEAQGIVIKNEKTGVVRKHPACQVEKDSMAQFLSAMRLLGLDRTVV